MPKLIIDEIAVDVPDGTTVLEAAQSVDIPIPHFCWHPALGRAGACRVCAVKMIEGPVKGIQMSCMLPVQEGMVVSTTDPEALALRRHVIEWLMINHPHDCPVCDEGGECQLQDYTIAGGHGIRRYSGKKRTHVNQDLGPYIQHEMNRCIQCYRCVRFYQEYAGGTDFGVMGSAGKVYFGRFSDGQLESPFSGNLVDICPTGVFTDKTARFRARYWDYDMAPSICPGCSLGCNTTPVARYREHLKTVARRNDAVNGWFICDRGRFMTTGVNDPLRPRIATVDGNATEIDEALNALVLRITEIGESFGPGSIAIVGSPRMTLETAVLLPQLAQCLSSGSLSFFTGQEEHNRACRQYDLLVTHQSASQQEVRESDCIIVFGCDPLQDAPMMALAIRQACRNGAKVFSVGNSIELTCEFSNVPALEDVPISAASRPVIIYAISADPAVLCAVLERYDRLKPACIFPAANSYAAALLTREHGAISLEEALADGTIKGIIAVEADIPAEMLKDVPFVAALDWRATAAVQSAQIFIPTTAWVEMDGTCINNEGRVQRFSKVMNPGLPIRGLDPSGHPSHVHRLTAPGGDAIPAWQIVAGLIESLVGERISQPLSGRWQQLQELDAESQGVMINDL